MTEFPEIERLREQAVGVGDTIDGRRPRVVRLPDAEQAVRDAVERVMRGWFESQYSDAVRDQAVRECVEALRERASNLPRFGQRLADITRYYGDAADFLERTMLGGESS